MAFEHLHGVNCLSTYRGRICRCQLIKGVVRILGSRRNPQCEQLRLSINRELAARNASEASKLSYHEESMDTKLVSCISIAKAILNPNRKRESLESSIAQDVNKVDSVDQGNSGKVEMENEGSLQDLTLKKTQIPCLAIRCLNSKVYALKSQH